MWDFINHFLKINQKSLCGLLTKVLDGNVIWSQFDPQSCFHKNFQSSNVGKYMNLYTPNYIVSCNTPFFFHVFVIEQPVKADIHLNKKQTNSIIIPKHCKPCGAIADAVRIFFLGKRCTCQMTFNNPGTLIYH